MYDKFQSSWRTELVFLSLISHIIIVLLMKFFACMWRHHVLNPKLKGTPKFLYLSGYFPAAMLMSHGGSSTWRPHTGFCNFVQNILMNIWSLVKHTNWKLGKVSSLWISYNITISWLYPWNGFRMIFCIASGLPDSASQEYMYIYSYRHIPPVEDG